MIILYVDTYLLFTITNLYFHQLFKIYIFLMNKKILLGIKTMHYNDSSTPLGKMVKFENIYIFFYENNRFDLLGLDVNHYPRFW